MDLSKMISLIAEVAVKKATRDREGSSNKTTPEAVLMILQLATTFAQQPIGSLFLAFGINCRLFRIVTVDFGSRMMLAVAHRRR